MKPRNKFQQRIVEASKKLPKITNAQVQWAYKNCLEHIGRRTSKGVITCTECGHSWQSESGELINTLLGCECPNCKTQLKVETTRKRIFRDYQYLCIVTACEGYQVLRYLYVECTAKVGSKKHYSHLEVVQRWIAPNGKYATMARLRPMGYFVHGWNWGSSLELRPERALYNITPTCVYPRQKLIPELKRTGYKEPYGSLTPFDLIYFLLSQTKAETLLKAGQTQLLHLFAYNGLPIDKYWPSIRICIRNGYTIAHPTEWRDYIDLLDYFGKDLHNAKYVCPSNLKAEHDRYVAKKQAEYDRQRLEEKRKRALKDEQKFKELKAKFFGIEFTDGLIHVRVLESVEEVMNEGQAMHHCVFTNNYHLKKDSLILSATIDGKRAETVEVSLSKLKVVQCRGACNKNTEYHDQIIALVNKNKRLIRKRLAA